MKRSILLLAAALSTAAYGMEMQGISVDAVERVAVAPTVLRMTVNLDARADTLDKALADMQARIEQAQTKLTALKPVEGTLKVTGPYAQDAENSQAQMMRMMRGRFSSGAQAAKPETPAQTHLVAKMEADWPLPAGDGATRLKEAARLREAIAAVFPKEGEKPKAEPAAADEAAEEAALMAAAMAASEEDESGIKPNQPMFGYIARLSDEQLAKARQDAVAKARTTAARIAAAAGTGLGDLRGIADNVSPSSGDDATDYAMAQYMRNMFGSSRAFSLSESEGQSFTLRDVTFNVSVQAVFDFGK